MARTREEFVASRKWRETIQAVSRALSAEKMASTDLKKGQEKSEKKRSDLPSTPSLGKASKAKDTRQVVKELKGASAPSRLPRPKEDKSKAKTQERTKEVKQDVKGPQALSSRPRPEEVKDKKEKPHKAKPKHPKSSVPAPKDADKKHRSKK